MKVLSLIRGNTATFKGATDTPRGLEGLSRLSLALTRLESVLEGNFRPLQSSYGLLATT